MQTARYSQIVFNKLQGQTKHQNLQIRLKY